ncbi:unnamed protein product [Malus baccata var. baccata]
MDVCQRFQFRLTMLFLYTGLALREYILRISGSDIRPCMVDIPSLLCYIEKQPNCSQTQRGVQLFLQWDMMQMQGFAMLLQNRHQCQRLYT